MRNIEDFKPNLNAIKFLVVGASGTGKSVFASSFPMPGVLFDLDEEAISYRRCKSLMYNKPYEESYKGWVAFEKDLSMLLKEIDKACEEGTCKYKTVILDNTTALTKLAMYYELAKHPTGDGLPIFEIHYAKVKGLVFGVIRRLIRLKKLGLNVVVIAHTEMRENKKLQTVAIVPLLTGKLAFELPTLFDEVLYSVVKQSGGSQEWLLQTVPKGLHCARSRLSHPEAPLPPLVPNNYTAVMELVKKSEALLDKKQANKPISKS